VRSKKHILEPTKLAESRPPNYYRASFGAVIVYDITERATYNNVAYWLGELRDHVRPTMTVLIGNKTDLEHLRVVSTEEARAFASE
jgi:Ras-related protein Rab-11A